MKKINCLVVPLFFIVINLSLFGGSAKQPLIKDNLAYNKNQERTLSIIKPDAVKDKLIGEILSRLERANLRVVAIKMEHLSKEQAEQFYAIHKNRPFFKRLISFMTSGPVIISVLEGEKAVERNRKLMGSTDPIKADTGTIRSDFAKNVTSNAIHGSDSVETAKDEIAFFFPGIN